MNDKKWDKSHFTIIYNDYEWANVWTRATMILIIN